MAALKLALSMVWLVVLAMPAQANAASTVSLEVPEQKLDITPYLDVYEDPEARHSADDLRTRSFNARFKSLDRNSANFGFSFSDWWVRFTVRNSQAVQQNATVLLDYPLLDYVDVWVFSGQDELADWQTGNRRAFDTRALKHRDFLFPLSLSPGEEQTVYLRIRSDGPVNIGLSLYSEQALLPQVELEYMAFGAYFGGFFLLALCIFLLYLVDRQAAFLYYLIYILSYSCYMMAFNGFAFQYIWPNAPEFGQVSRPVLLTFSIIFLLQFSRALLGIKRLSPFLHRSVTILQVVLGVILLSVSFVPYGMLVMPLAVLNLAALFLVLVMGVWAQLKGEAAASYYLLAWSVFLIGLLAYLLKVFGYLPHNFLTHYGFQIGSFFEFAFLSVALGVRIAELNENGGNRGTV